MNDFEYTEAGLKALISKYQTHTDYYEKMIRVANRQGLGTGKSVSQLVVTIAKSRLAQLQS